MILQSGKRGYSTKYICKADLVDRKSRQYTIFPYSVQARLSVHTDWICSMYGYVFGAIISSSILRAHLYATPSSMAQQFWRNTVCEYCLLLTKI